MRTPKTDTLHNASALARFAQNYKVEALDIEGYLADSIERDPVGVYAIAVTHGYMGIGTKAARLSLNLPFSKLQSPYLQCATAEHISELFGIMLHVERLPAPLHHQIGHGFRRCIPKEFLAPKVPMVARMPAYQCPAPDLINHARPQRSPWGEGDQESHQVGKLITIAATVLCLRRLTVHAHMLQVPLPKVVSDNATSNRLRAQRVRTTFCCIFLRYVGG
jgi:hypothetical protein